MFQFDQYSSLQTCQHEVGGQTHGTWLLCELPQDLFLLSPSVMVARFACGRIDLVEGTLASRPEDATIVGLRAAL